MKAILTYGFYRGKDEFLTKVNVAQMGAQVANELRGKSYDDRFNWIMQVKDEGNKLFKEEKLDEAIDIYMKALCGLDFSSYEILESPQRQKEKDLKVSRDLKAPILNNIALCLNKQGKYQRANAMLDQVLDADLTNNKAWQRKIQNLILLGQVEEAANVITKAEKYAIQEDDKSKLRQFKSKIQDTNNKEKDFSKKVFSGSASQPLYQDKTTAPVIQTPEVLNKEENEMLGTISNVHWLLYPFIKTAKALCGKKASKLD